MKHTKYIKQFILLIILSSVTTAFAGKFKRGQCLYQSSSKVKAQYLVVNVLSNEVMIGYIGEKHGKVSRLDLVKKKALKKRFNNKSCKNDEL